MYRKIFCILLLIRVLCIGDVMRLLFECTLPGRNVCWKCPGRCWEGLFWS